MNTDLEQKKAIKKRRIIIMVVILLLVMLTYKSDKVMFDFSEGFFAKAHKLLAQDNYVAFILKVNLLSRLEYQLNPFFLKKDLSNGELPVFDLRFSKNDMIHFKETSKEAMEIGYLSENNTWRSAELKYGKEVYKIEAKLRGDMRNHWAGKLKSYGIKTEKEKYVNNIRRFNLFIFEDKLLKGRISRLIANDLGLFDVRDDFVVVKINGITQGLYYLQDQMDELFLDYNKCSNCYAFSLNDNYFEDHPLNRNDGDNKPYGVFLGERHQTSFDYEISKMDLGRGGGIEEEKVLAQAERLFDVIKKEDYKKIIEFFDLDYITSIEALKVITGQSQFTTGDNLEIVYSATNSKFYIIPRNEAIVPLKFERGGFERELAIVREIDLGLPKLLIKNDKIRQLRNKKLYDYITTTDLLTRVDELMDFYIPYAKSYESNFHSPRYLEYLIKEDKKILQQNLRTIKESLEYSKCYINIIEEQNTITLKIMPDSLSQIRFTKFALNLSEPYKGSITLRLEDLYNPSLTRSLTISNEISTIDLTEKINDLYFAARLDEELYPEKTDYIIKLIFWDTSQISINNFEIRMQNDITKEGILSEDIYVQIADSNGFVPGEDFLFSQFQEEFPEFKFLQEGNTITLLKGKYKIYKDMVIPKNYKLNIEKGTEISLAKDTSILTYQPLTAIGTSSEPIIIKAINPDEPFGAFGVIGKYYPQEPTILKWVEISGGNEEIINGIYLSGALSVYHTDAILENVRIYGNHADDGLIIKYSKVSIINSVFKDNFADQIDLDFCTGMVENSFFGIEKRGDSNGDGLDLSGSRIIINNNQFKGLADKGISIGEETQVLVINNKLTNNNMSMAVKDSSEAYIINNNMENNNIAIASYQKKLSFDGGISFIFGNTYNSNKKDYEIDELSKVNKITITPEELNLIDKELNLIDNYLQNLVDNYVQKTRIDNHIQETSLESLFTHLTKIKEKGFTKIN